MFSLTNLYVLILTLLCTKFTVADESDGGHTEVPPWCSMGEPHTTVTGDPRVWRHGERPARDDLDSYFIETTRRHYWSGNASAWHDLPPATFDGVLHERRLALRSPAHVALVVSWGDHPGVAFFIGELDNTVTNVFNRSQWTKLWQLSTPAILSVDTYVPFYVRLERDRLTFGHECDPRLQFAHEVTAVGGAPVSLAVQFLSGYGGKVLFAPPLNSGLEPLCRVVVPSTVLVSNSTWHSLERPDQDHLDRFLVRVTGCKYWGGATYEQFTAASGRFDGHRYQWRGAVRPGDTYSATTDLTVTWGVWGIGYVFALGNSYNSYTSVSELPGESYREGTRSPELLSSDAYLPLRVTLDPDQITLETECGPQLMLHLNATVAMGAPITISLTTKPFGGGKLLYDCPDLYTGPA